MSLSRRLSLFSLAVVLGLTGCAGADTREEFSADVGFIEPMPGMMVEESMPMEALGDSSVSSDRSQIITGDIYLTVDSPSEAAQEVSDIVTDAGGRVDSISESTDPLGNRPSAYLWVRIPVDVLEATLEQIEELGVVENKTLNNSDVTLQVVDLDARINVLQESITRLEELLATAETTADIVEIEMALSSRQAELDSLQSQRNYLADQIEFASIGVDLRTSEEAPEREAGSFLDGIVSGWNALLAFFAGTVVFFGFILPWLGLAVALVIVIAIIVAIRRRTRQ